MQTEKRLNGQASAALRSRKAPWKLTFAIIIALATAVFVGCKPVDKEKVRTDPAIVQDPQGAVLVTMEAEFDGQAAEHLEDFYEIRLPEGWKNSGEAKLHPGEGENVWDLLEQSWRMEGQPGRILLGQITARRYAEQGENCVDVLDGLSVTQPITTEKVQMAGQEMLKVKIPPQDPDSRSDCCEGGETRLYWCDGQYIVYFVYPYWVEDAGAEQMLNTLARKKAPWSYPLDLGSIDHERISDAYGNFYMEGLTVPQYPYLYSDGCIWFGGWNALLKYDIATAELERIRLRIRYMSSFYPQQLFDAGDYIVFYSDHAQYRVRKDGQGLPEAIREGNFDLAYVFYYDMWSYEVKDHAIVRTHILTGEEQTLAEGIERIWAQDGGIYAVPEGVWDVYWFFDMECTAYEVVPIDPQWPDTTDIRWLKATPVGDVRVLTAEYGKMYLERNGQLTSMEVNGRDLVAREGRLYYLPADLEDTRLCVYDPATDSHETLMEEVSSFAIVADRYLVCCKASGNIYVFTDLQTDQSVTFDLDEIFPTGNQ